MAGLKSVIFVTGSCPENCYYCPISLEKRGRDVTYANEVRVESVNDVIAEVSTSGSKGAGLTGGDPLLKLKYLKELIKVLKDFFGRDFHTHLYTSGILLTEDSLRELVRVGLDELRIHVTGPHSWRALEKAVKFKGRLDVGVENPALPGSSRELKELVRRVREVGGEFVNLNELEFSESNYESLILRGFRASEGVAAEGSEEVAIEVLKWVEEEGLDINVHYCPARFKDRYQFRLRLVRRALRTRRVFEEIGPGTVRWASVISCPEDLIRELLAKGLLFKSGSELLGREDLLKALGCKYSVIEAYPTTPRRILNEYPP